MDKVKATASDATVRDIVPVLLAMQLNPAYSVARDDAVMTELDRRIDALDSDAERPGPRRSGANPVSRALMVQLPPA